MPGSLVLETGRKVAQYRVFVGDNPKALGDMTIPMIGSVVRQNQDSPVSAETANLA